MSRDFFDTDNGDKLGPDRVGLVVGDPHAARIEAMKALPEMARDVLRDENERTVFVSVRSEHGPTFFRATLTLKCDWSS